MLNVDDLIMQGRKKDGPTPQAFDSVRILLREFEPILDARPTQVICPKENQQSSIVDTCMIDTQSTSVPRWRIYLNSGSDYQLRYG